MTERGKEKMTGESGVKFLKRPRRKKRQGQKEFETGE